MINIAFLNELFARRFEPDGLDYVFRSSIRAPGIRVSAAERDRFVAQFCGGMTRLYWIMIAAMVTVFGLVSCLFLTSILTMAWLQPLLWGSVLLIAVPYFVIYQRLWSGPTRTLQGRPLALPARSPVEARRTAFERLTWRQLGVAVLLIAVGLWRIGENNNLMFGWNRLWLVVAGVALLLIGVQAFRKWRSSMRPTLP